MGGGPDSPPTIRDGCGGARSPDAREPGIVAVRWSGSNDRGHAGGGPVGRGSAPDLRPTVDWVGFTNPTWAGRTDPRAPGCGSRQSLTPAQPAPFCAAPQAAILLSHNSHRPP